MRDASAQSTIEMICGVVILVPVVLLAIDLVTIYSGCSLNNRMCSDAARAAASGPPDAITKGAPKKRADSLLQTIYTDATVKKYNILGTVNIHPECAVSEQLTSPIPDPALGGPIDGQVTVDTTIDVIPPFLIKEFVPKGITLTSRQTFPYTYNVPGTNNAPSSDASANSNPSPGGTAPQAP